MEEDGIVDVDQEQTKSRQPSKTMKYGETLMYGQYSKDLGQFAKKEATRIKILTNKNYSSRYKSYNYCYAILLRVGIWIRVNILQRIGEDWVFLTLLGVTMALLSFMMDYVIEKCQTAHGWLFEELAYSIPLQYIAWVIFPLVFICFSTGFVHIVGPNAIGSGIPEMKTVLRGVVLKEYLTFRTLVSKMVGLCSSLGSGLPIGKEGPFVHVASITATLLGQVITSFRGIYENESRNSEMLAAACAVGVACTFAAPIGGVLFSIEVTSTYFAVRNYWRGFYSAVCGAFVFRLLAIFFHDEETVTALFKTNLRQDFPFDPLELFIFAIIGIICGFGGALFVYTHRKIVEWIRKQRRLTEFLQRNRFIFPSVVVFIISSLFFPPGLGQFMAGELTNREAVNQLFSNHTWSLTGADNTEDPRVMHAWTGAHSNIYLTLSLFIIMRFWMSAIAITLPIPAGVFMPVFTIGAAFGRLIGECMAVWFPNGISGRLIVPGGYAIVGAAALSGSVTHTISTSVIVFELTGQMGHVLPAIIAVLLANVIAHCLQYSIYDSMIHIKRLPYLPDMINPETVKAHEVTVQDFMVRDLHVLTLQSTYHEVLTYLQRYNLRAMPLVESPDSMILMGSIQRFELENLLEKQLETELSLTCANSPESPTQSTPTTTTNNDSDNMNESNNETPSKQPSARFQVTPTLSHTNSVDNVPASPNTLKMQQHYDWENRVLSKVVNFDMCVVDPAPFQLVERTSLYKVHSIFSLLSLQQAYVTNMGRLIGVVSLQEVRHAVQGTLTAYQMQQAMNREKQKKGMTTKIDNTSDKTDI